MTDVYLGVSFTNEEIEAVLKRKASVIKGPKI